VIYLVDRSAWEQLRYSRDARQGFRRLAGGNELAVTPVVAAELLFSARNHQQLLAHRHRLERLTWLESGNDVQERMLSVQQQLARVGKHRSVGIPDLMVAATAEAHRAVVLHYDSDFERIAEITGQPHEWIVPRGTGHGTLR
jgi:predicted nucleic acid-binding protein